MTFFENHKKRVLVVEDDSSILELVTTRLELAGYQTSVARDGAVALACVEAIEPDAMILDLNMPGTDGFRVLEALRRRTKGKLPRVMVLTARCAPEDVRRCLALGALDYMAKPFDDRTLLRRVARLVATSSSASRPASPAA